jgi:AcrR family transcriptional regulator
VTRRDRRTVEVRREEILTATIDLLDRVGLASIRVADVAGALGVSPALVFYHFGTKDALVADAFAHAVDRDLHRIDEATSRGADPMDRLLRVLRLYGPTGEASGWRVWIDAWALAQREPVRRPFHPAAVERAQHQGLYTHWQGYLSALRYTHAPEARVLRGPQRVGVFDTSPLFKYRITGPTPSGSWPGRAGARHPEPAGPARRSTPSGATTAAS